MRRTRTFKVVREYNWFAPGTIVTPVAGAPLPVGKQYTVINTVQPEALDTDSVVILKEHLYGISGQYLKEVI